MDLDPDQRHFVDAIKRHGTRAGGYAGTGKTKCIAQAWGELAQDDRPPIIAAPTHKACDVLRKHMPGAEVRTLHSLTMEYVADEPVRDEDGELILDKDGRSLRQPRFSPRETPINRHVIIDEASMVGAGFLGRIEHLLPSYAFVGDPFQLPPVKDEQLFDRTSCDVMLTKVYRQGTADPALEYATGIRECRNLEPPAGVEVVRRIDNPARWPPRARSSLLRPTRLCAG